MMIEIAKSADHEISSNDGGIPLADALYSRNRNSPYKVSVRIERVYACLDVTFLSMMRRFLVAFYRRIAFYI